MLAFDASSWRVTADTWLDRQENGLGEQAAEGWRLPSRGEYHSLQSMTELTFSFQWLHLSAFSWGGFADVTQTEDGYSTSQNFENLVFGTSETNSVMTRYGDCEDQPPQATWLE
jgi:hypothetical protein